MFKPDLDLPISFMLFLDLLSEPNIEATPPIPPTKSLVACFLALSAPAFLPAAISNMSDF